MCFRRYFIAQSVEHRTGIAEVMGSNPVGASEFFLGFICNCLSYFTTVKISFTSILYPQFTHIIFIIIILFKNYYVNEYDINKPLLLSCMHVYIYVLCVCVCVCVCVLVFVRNYVRMYVYMFVCLCLCDNLKYMPSMHTLVCISVL